MIKHLHIQNFTLIDKLDIEFQQGFSVITGETGAGKSIILGAIALLTGNRADTKLIRLNQKRCLIEAHFDISKYQLKGFFERNDIDYDANDCILRREINASGKSRAFINDTPAPLTAMKELGEQLIDIHSQHQNLMLQKEDFQLHVVDIITQNEQILDAYKQSFLTYKKAEQHLNALKDELKKNQENEDFLRFQYQELTNANLIEGEQETLEQDLTTLEHAEEIKTVLYQTQNLLSNETNGIVDALSQVKQLLHNIQEVYTPVQDITNRIEGCYIETKDLLQEITTQTESIDYNPQQLEQTQARLDIINTLQHKFHVSCVAELLNIQNKIHQQLLQIDNSDEEINKQQTIVTQLLTTCQEKANLLTNARQKAANVIEKEMQKRLIPLGIPQIQFKVDVAKKELSLNGQDKVSFLFSANSYSPLQPVSQVASGGEIARVMLSLKAMISRAVKLPTIIFDEIDTGVSGNVAEKMAQIMKEMGECNRQVISITHLPQIAALGSHHYKVLKTETNEGTISTMYHLDEQQRVKEIAKMLSGSNITQAALDNACELLNLKKY